MADVCLYIRNPLEPLTEFQADLKDAEGITLTYAINDLSLLSSPQMPYTKGVTLVGTKETNRALRNLYRMDVLGDEILNLDMEARLVVDGKDVLEGSGILQIAKINHQPDGTVEYECDLTGGGYSWVSAFATMKWCDVDLGSFTWDGQVHYDTWDRAGKVGPAYGWDYIGCTFFPVHYGWWKDGSGSVSRDDLRPHLYIRWMLTKAFLELGWTLAGDYVESDYFSSLVHLFTRGKWGKTIDPADVFIETITDDGHIYSPMPWGGSPAYLYFRSTNGYAGNDADYWNTDEWTMPLEGRVTINFTVEPGQFFYYTTNVYFVVEINGTEVASTETAYDFTNGLEIIYETCLAATDIVKLKFKYDPATSPPPDYPVLFVLADMAQLVITLHDGTYLCDGNTVTLCEAVDPTLNVLDVVKGITHLDNLFWVTDKATMTVTPYVMGTYPVTLGRKEGGLLECGQLISVAQQDNYCRNVKIGFKPDSKDQYQGWYRTQEGIDLYSYNREGGDAACLRESINPTYAATWHVSEKDGPNRLSSSTGLTTGGVIDFRPTWLSMTKHILTKGNILPVEDTISHDFEPRIAIYEGLVDDTDIGWFTALAWYFDNEDGDGVDLESGYYPHAYLMDWWNGTRQGIGYSDLELETKAPDLGPGTIITAPGKSSSTWELGVRSGTSTRVMEAVMYLTQDDISVENLSSPRFITHPMIGQARYLITKISDWSPATGLAKVTLLLFRE